MCLRVPRPLDVGILDDLIDLPQLLVSKHYIATCTILASTLGVPGAMHAHQKCKWIWERNVGRTMTPEGV